SWRPRVLRVANGRPPRPTAAQSPAPTRVQEGRHPTGPRAHGRRLFVHVLSKDIPPPAPVRLPSRPVASPTRKHWIPTPPFGALLVFGSSKKLVPVSSPSATLDISNTKIPP